MATKLAVFLGTILCATNLNLLEAQNHLNKLKWVQCSQNRSSHQIMFDFTQPTTYTKRICPTEGKLIVGFPGMKIINFNPKDVTTTLNKLKESQFIKEVSVTEEYNGVLLSLQFSAERSLHKKTIPNRLLLGFRKINDERNHKLIIDICPNELLKNETIQYAQASVIQSDYTAPFSAKKPTRKNKRDWRIIIDPGHGGKDGGALGFGGLKEKDIALRIARSLAKKLGDEGYNTHLTRSCDEYLSPSERTALAHQLNADLFVSIHLNSADNPIHGIETFYMKNQQSEEYNQSREYIFINQEANDSLITRAEQTLQETLNCSKKLATHIQSELIATLSEENHNPTNRGIREQNYRLFLNNSLLNTSIPTAIVEVGFVTNPKESKLLGSHHYQQLVANGIFNGIKDYTQKATR